MRISTDGCQHLGLLRLMGMLGTCVDLELRRQCLRQPVLRKHAGHRLLDQAVGMAGTELLGTYGANSAGKSAVVMVGLLALLLAGELDLGGIDDDHEIAATDVLRER